MRILIVHERYAIRAGEDSAVDSETEHLRSRGHEIHAWFPDNAEISAWPMFRRLRLAYQTTWSGDSSRRMRGLINEKRPDIVHFHNTLPMISPSALWAAHRAGATVVQTLHNYRLLCPKSTLLRDQRICEDCVSYSLFRSVVHACYRDSRLQTAAVAMMLAAHRRLQTWKTCVDAFIAPTEFMRSYLIRSGLPADRVHVKPNVLRGNGHARRDASPNVAYVGRLSEEKGIRVLLRAVETLSDVRFVIAGAGPLEPEVIAVARQRSNLRFLGPLDHGAAQQTIADATVLVLPSICYETFGMTILEGMSMGVPAIASRIGGIPEIVAHGDSGLLVAPGDVDDMVRSIRQIMTDDPLRSRLSAGARSRFQRQYSEDQSYEALMSIYREASRRCGR